MPSKATCLALLFFNHPLYKNKLIAYQFLDKPADITPLSFSWCVWPPIGWLEEMLTFQPIWGSHWFPGLCWPLATLALRTPLKSIIRCWALTDEPIPGFRRWQGGEFLRPEETAGQPLYYFCKIIFWQSFLWVLRFLTQCTKAKLFMPRFLNLREELISL